MAKSPDRRARLRRMRGPGLESGRRLERGPAASSATQAPIAAPTLAQLIGQKLVVRMSGTTPTADLLGRISRGEVGGVIIFGFNIVSRHPADRADRATPGSGNGGRPAEAPHRGRPGGRLDQARAVGPADHVGQADGHRRSDVGRTGAGDGHRVGTRGRSASTSTWHRSRTCRSTAARSCTSGSHLLDLSDQGQPSRERIRCGPRVDSTSHRR